MIIILISLLITLKLGEQSCLVQLVNPSFKNGQAWFEMSIIWHLYQLRGTGNYPPTVCLFPEPKTYWEWPEQGLRLPTYKAAKWKPPSAKWKWAHLRGTQRQHLVSRQSREEGRVQWEAPSLPHSPACGVDREACNAVLEFLGKLALAGLLEQRGGPCGTLPVSPIPWQSSPPPQGSSHPKSLSRPRRDPCQGEEGKVLLPQPSWSPNRDQWPRGFCKSHWRISSGCSKRTRRHSPGLQDALRMAEGARQEGEGGMRGALVFWGSSVCWGYLMTRPEEEVCL